MDGSSKTYEDLIKENDSLRKKIGKLEQLRSKRTHVDELEEIRDKLAAIAEGSAIPQFAIDKNHTVILWNKALEIHSGILAQNVLGTSNHWKAFYRKKRPCLVDLVVESAAGGEIERWYGDRYSKSNHFDGTYEATGHFPLMKKGAVWLHFTATAIKSPSGQIIAGIETLEDITRLRNAETLLNQAEETASKSKKQFLTLAENAPFGMLLIDKQGNFVYLNQVFREIFGYTLEEIPNGMKWFEQVYPDPDYRHAVISTWIDDLKNSEQGRKRPRVYNVACKDGRTKIINFIPVQLPSGETIMSCEDITESKNIERAIEESRTTLRSLIDATQETLIMIDPAGTILVANRTASQRLGRNVQELIATCLYDYFHPEVSTRRKREYDKVFETGIPAYFADERKGRIYESYVYPVFNDEGRVEKAVIFSSDITEREEAQRQVRLNEARLQSLYEIYRSGTRNTQDILTYALDRCVELTASKIGCLYSYDENKNVFALSARSRIKESNRAPAEHKTTHSIEKTGIAEQTLRQRTPIVLNSPPDSPLKKDYSGNSVENSRILAIPVLVDGRAVLVAVVADKETDYDQYDVRQLTLLMDSVWRIARQREADKALRESEEKYRNIFENASEGIFQVTPAGRFIGVNPALARMAGYSSPDEMMEMIDNSAQQLYAYPEERDKIVDLLNANGAVRGYIVLHKKKGGGTFWGSVNARAVKNADGEILYHEGTLEDITERRLAEIRLREVLSQLEEKNKELSKTYDELKESQKRTIQSEKMASIGQLAAGVAHEINNPMGFVISNLNSLKKYTTRLHDFYRNEETTLETLSLSDEQQRQHILNDIKANKNSLKINFILEDIPILISESLDGANRVKKIVQDLKSFSRVDDAAFITADIHTVLETTLNIVWNELKHRAKVDKDYGEIPLTRCNPGHLSQVFMNILINAAHAIPGYGTITIRTWHDPHSIFVAISDNGIGIPEHNIKKLFDPFFTTKEAGKGTGLGLSIANDIISKHNGEIMVSSVVGRGTTMTVRIPILQDKGKERPDSADMRR